MPGTLTRKLPPGLPLASATDVPIQPQQSRWRSVLVRVLLFILCWAALCLAMVQFCFPELSIPEFRQSSSLPPTDSKPSNVYLAGAGRADITGPVVEINMMGYADPAQVGSGLRQRLYSRAFIVAEKADPSRRLVYLVLDTQSGDTAIRNGILDELRDLGEPYSSLYGTQNIAVTGTHSHSGPGAWLNYLLPQITSKGFDKQSYNAIVSGAVLSIMRAHESLAPARLALGKTKLRNASINRSLYAYLANPESERRKYISEDDDGSVDTDMKLLRFQRAADNKTFAVLTWFPTHGTSMLGNNTLISGDNKGVAASLLEKTLPKQSSESFSADFIAGFSQAHVGDVSPNVLGAWCEDGSGMQCSFENSTCADGRSQSCHARGPLFRVADNGASSCFEIGQRQADAARRILFAHSQQPPMAPITGGAVRAVHVFHNMSDFEFSNDGKTELRTCPAALGYSFAAGTSDGPGAFDFTQNDGDGADKSPVWKAVSHLLKSPSRSQRACHSPKPILLDVGEVTRPYAWTPNIVDIQLFRIGNLAIIVSPGEATTMAGRRWMHAVQQRALQESRGDAVHVVLGGPANTYTHYISTAEEYAIQRYEGASTLYGPHTLAAYINRTVDLVPALYSTAALPPTAEIGAAPPDNRNVSLSFITGVVYDGHMPGAPFGHVVRDVDRRAYQPGEAVQAVFVGANPRNNLRQGDTYAAVERRVGAHAWVRVRDDSDWALVFEWRRRSSLLGTSEVTLTWHIEAEAEPGQYRLRYFGDSKALGGKITAFNGTSGEFEVGL